MFICNTTSKEISPQTMPWLTLKYFIIDHGSVFDNESYYHQPGQIVSTKYANHFVLTVWQQYDFKELFYMKCN